MLILRQWRDRLHLRTLVCIYVHLSASVQSYISIHRHVLTYLHRYANNLHNCMHNQVVAPNIYNPLVIYIYSCSYLCGDTPISIRKHTRRNARTHVHVYAYAHIKNNYVHSVTCNYTCTYVYDYINTLKYWMVFTCVRACAGVCLCRHLYVRPYALYKDMYIERYSDT